MVVSASRPASHSAFFAVFSASIFMASANFSFSFFKVAWSCYVYVDFGLMNIFWFKFFKIDSRNVTNDKHCKLAAVHL